MVRGFQEIFKGFSTCFMVREYTHLFYKNKVGMIFRVFLEILENLSRVVGKTKVIFPFIIVQADT